MRDELWDMMLHVCGYQYDELTPSARGWVNQGVKELRDIGASPDELLKRSRKYWHKFKRRPSPSAISKHWSSLGDTQPFSSDIQVDAPCEHLFSDMDDGDERGRYCPRCKSWQPHAVQLKLIDGEMA